MTNIVAKLRAAKVTYSDPQIVSIWNTAIDACIAIVEAAQQEEAGIIKEALIAAKEWIGWRAESEHRIEVMMQARKKVDDALVYIAENKTITAKRTPVSLAEGIKALIDLSNKAMFSGINCYSSLQWEHSQRQRKADAEQMAKACAAAWNLEVKE